MALRDSTDFLNDDDHPFPFTLNVQDPQGHAFLGSFIQVPHGSAENHAVLGSFIQDPHAQNTTAVETFDSFAPRNLHGSGYGWLNQAENTASVSEGLESAMERLTLSNNPFIKNNTATTSMGLCSGPHDYTTNLVMDPTGNNILSSVGYDNNNHRFRRLSCEELLGFLRSKVVSMAKDHYECRVLQKKINEGKPEEIETILSCVKDHLYELMIHPSGNYLMQKIFQAHSVNVEHMNTIVQFIIVDVEKLKDVCMHRLGTWAVQKMLENLKTPNQIYAVTWVMKLITVGLMKNINGGYVIQQCLKLFPCEYKMVILDEIAKNSLDIAMDKCGCSVIKKCLGFAEEEAIYKLVPTIISNAEAMAEDPYGNCVVQFLVKMEKMGPSAIQHVIKSLHGKYVELSMNKYGSNVVEDLLQFSQTQDAATIVLEIMNSPEFLNVVRDPFGNYVVQKALQYTKDFLHRRLSEIILSNYASLRSDPYGKKVLACAKGSELVYKT